MSILLVLVIADRVGCSPSTIYRRLEAAGVYRRPASPRVSRRNLLKALDRGQSAPDIADARWVSVSCVCRALARQQLMTRGQAFMQRRRLRLPELHPGATLPLPTSASAATTSAEGFPNLALTLCEMVG